MVDNLTTQSGNSKNKIYKIIGISLGIIVIISSIALNYFTKHSLYNGRIADNIFIQDIVSYIVLRLFLPIGDFILPVKCLTVGGKASHSTGMNRSCIDPPQIISRPFLFRLLRVLPQLSVLVI